MRRVTLLLLLLIIIAVIWWFFFRTEAAPVVRCETNTNNLLPPEVCDPSWLAGVNFTDPPPVGQLPLAQLPASACQNPLLPAGVGQCTVRTYTDVNNQKFTIEVEGVNPDAFNTYLATAKPYFIVQQTQPNVPFPPDLNLPELPPILIESTGLSREALRDIRDSLAKQRGPEGELVTLEDVLLAAAGGELPLITLSPGEVLKIAIDRANSEVGTAAEAAGLTGQEIEELLSTLPEAMEALMKEPGATFLDDPAVLPQDAASYRKMLQSNPASLAITLNWASAPTGRSWLEELLRFLPNIRRLERQEAAPLWAVWFAIDPELLSKMSQTGPNIIYQNAYHAYRAQCNVYSASAQIYASAGSMTNSFWRANPYYYIGARTADAQFNPAPSAQWHNSYPSLVSYDTSVVGGPGGGTYYIYGGWIQGYDC